MGVYSNVQILDGIKSGNIIVDPFNPKHVNGSSYDVLLGEYFYKSGNEEPNKLYNPYNEQDVAAHFGEALRAQPLREHSHIIKKLGITHIENIPEDHPVIILRPLERILAHTQEFIGIKNGTTSMQARSTTGRNGVVVCMDAGWGDPGYINRWTMEIKNHNEQYVVLPVGIRIAQIVFHETGDVDGEYSQLSGKYQTTKSDDLATIKANWKPSDMLPKAYKDTIELLKPVAGTKY
jgi:dCTP deaminase